MPVRKKSQKKEQQRTVKARATKTHKTKTVACKPEDVLVNTLKENNKSLASALDESRQECRQLQLECLTFQQERQELMEKMASLDTKLRDRDQELISHNVQPALLLLERAEQDITLVKQHLSRLLAVRDSNQSAATTQPQTLLDPKLLSPIAEPDTRVRFSHPVATSSPTGSKSAYPTTPYPSHVSFKSPRFSSTPYKGTTTSTSPYPCCAIDFEECVSTPTPANCDALPLPQRADQGGCAVSPDEPGNENSPNLPSCKERRDNDSCSQKNSTLDELEQHLVRVQMSQRPRRKCSVLGTSYQEPSLHRKLRRGDPFTDNSMCQLSVNKEKATSKPKKASCSTRKNPKHVNLQPRLTLQDVTNKK